MRKHLLKKISLVVLLFTLFSSSLVTPTQAAYSDNPNGLYYTLSDEVYNGKSALQDKLIALYGKYASGTPRFKVIDYIDINSHIDSDGTLRHPMGALKPGKTQKFEKTGFSAAAVVSEGRSKLFIVFTGSNDMYDYTAAGKAVSAIPPGQEYQAQLYVNYIYQKFKKYQGYKWYFTGHSLGGWLAAKMDLDIRAARWLNDPSVLVYGGAIGKSTISGVYTFNALPISKVSVSAAQWNANKNGLYNKYVKNLYFENEWLNGVSDMHTGQLAYIGTNESINTGIKYYSTLGYRPSAIISANLANYYLYNALSLNPDQRAVTNAHDIDNFKNRVSY